MVTVGVVELVACCFEFPAFIISNQRLHEVPRSAERHIRRLEEMFTRYGAHYHLTDNEEHKTGPQCGRALGGKLKGRKRPYEAVYHGENSRQVSVIRPPQSPYARKTATG